MIPLIDVGSALAAMLNSPATCGSWFLPASHSSAEIDAQLVS